MGPAPPGEVVPIGAIRLDGVGRLRVGNEISGLIFDPAEEPEFVVGGSDRNQISRGRILNCHQVPYTSIIGRKNELVNSQFTGERATLAKRLRATEL